MDEKAPKRLYAYCVAINWFAQRLTDTQTGCLPNDGLHDMERA